MPAVQSSDTKVLVTGANGFVAIWIVRTLLEKGYSVRGAVRSTEKGVHLVESFKKYGDKFELTIVPDITKDGAFDKAVKGVHAIEHVASPVSFQVEDPQELIIPAVKGTISILQSALKHGGSSLRRIIVTSSFAAILPMSNNNLFVFPERKVLSEVDWNDQSVQEVEQYGKAATPGAKYRASKVLAEQAAWEFYHRNKNSIPWDLVVINPPFVFGPVIHDVPEPSALNVSTNDWYKTVLTPDAGGRSAEILTTGGNAWIDVRDLAEAESLALEKEAAGGERIMVSAGNFVWQDWIDVANSLSPSPIPSRVLSKGVSRDGPEPERMIDFDIRKEGKILGVKYRSKEETTRDTLADFERRGW